MRAWLLDELAGLERLRLAQAPDPVPKQDEALLEIHFAALNPADRYLAERQYPAKPQLPHILGRDGMGIVLNSSDDKLKPGARRAILRGDVGVDSPGTFAEKVAVPGNGLIEYPSEWTEPEAAGATLVYLTAYQALTMWGPLRPDATVLVTGASGGVGVASVQVATAMGYKVLALSRSAEKSRRLLQLGTAATFDPSDPQWRTAAKAAAGPARVDLAIDNIGGRLLPEVIEVMGELGKVSLVGRLAGPVPNFNTATLLFRRLRMGGVAVSAYANAEAHDAWERVLALLSRTGARPLVDSIFPFEQLQQAFARLAEGPMGKVVLQVK